MKERVDPGDAAIPRVFEIFEGEASVLGVGFLPLEGVFGPNALRVDELGFPRLNVSI